MPFLTNEEHSHLYKIVFKVAVKDRQVQAVSRGIYFVCMDSGKQTRYDVIKAIH